MISLFLWACPAKKAPEPQIELSQSPSQTPFASHSDKMPEEREPEAPFTGRQQTELLLTQGILDPLPERITPDVPITIQFRTLYRNGCWSQSNPEHQIDDFTITHSYTTSLASDRMCTMALLPGGFQTEITLTELGEYTGRIVVDGTERASYSLQVITAD